ncbi:hypothetical protein [Asticcacaulis solisilvae]|uniref:hypothetical protein n=1 Tax=Asticcacaulis solisilvae TaxID=1217274 RepID=UPI003FD7EC72
MPDTVRPAAARAFTPAATEEDDIACLLAHPAFDQAARHLAQGFSVLKDMEPRISSLFGAQQRWLLCHVAIGKCFECPPSVIPSVSRLDLINAGVAHGLASRNTIRAFILEALYYGIVQPVEGTPTSRNLRIGPTSKALYLLTGWYLLHLGALDLLDNAGRTLAFGAASEAGLRAMAPAIADGFLASNAIANPAPPYAQFAWVDEGGNLMDRLIAGIDAGADPLAERTPTNVASISALSESLSLSRTHAGRMVAAAEAQGSLGWSGRPGRSAIWLSRAFRQAYARAQAAKLAVVARAFRNLEPAGAGEAGSDHF